MVSHFQGLGLDLQVAATYLETQQCAITGNEANKHECTVNMQHLKTFQNSAFQLFYKEGTAFLCTQCVLMSKHKFCLFTRNVQ